MRATFHIKFSDREDRKVNICSWPSGDMGPGRDKVEEPDQKVPGYS